jgi:hypothetical protein
VYKGGRGSVGSVDFPLLRWGLLYVSVAVCVLCGECLIVCLVIAL